MNNQKKVLLLACFFMLTYTVIGQSLQEFKNGKEPFYKEKGGIGDHGTWGFALSVSNLSNPAAPNSNAHNITKLSMRMDYKRYRKEKGKSRMFYQNKSLGDVFTILGSELSSNTGVDQKEGSTISTFIGWSSWGWNVLVKEKAMVAMGFNINDYVVGTRYYYRDINGGIISQESKEPQGLYYGSGLSVFFDYALSEKVILQTLTSYTASFWRPVSLSYATVDSSYPKPHFLHFNAELQTSFKLFVGFDFTMLINRGDLPNDTRRLDILLGYRF
ncbi:MAG: hypothetical protein L6Q51_03395 [Cyclobacteriaceae bacterium]|nr:hypothetical protein [Cyclobacteriaceae bacterium]